MKVISFVSQKGGVGKSTLVVCLGVAAWQAGKKVLILDADPQGTAASWYESRDETSPELAEVRAGEVERGVQAGKDFDFVFIDTPARAEPVNAEAARASDFCIIPCQPSMADMRAAKPTVDALGALGRKGAFVLTRVPSRGSRATEAIRGLGVYSLAVAPVMIGNRTDYVDAYTSGMGVTEYAGEGKAAQEIKELWQWMAKRLSKGSTTTKM
jgi:chromosome partitioning protein